MGRPIVGAVWAWMLAAVLAGAGTAEARQSGSQAGAAAPADAEAQAIFREVMSPFCPGLTLADCPSPNAFALRGEILARLKDGESRATIVDELVAEYGAGILGDPSETPIGSVVWGVPLAISAFAAVGLALYLRRVTRPRAAEPLAAVAGPPGLRERLDEELSNLD